jgi:hypothetical protein
VMAAHEARPRATDVGMTDGTSHHDGEVGTSIEPSRCRAMRQRMARSEQEASQQLSAGGAGRKGTSGLNAKRQQT